MYGIIIVINVLILGVTVHLVMMPYSVHQMLTMQNALAVVPLTKRMRQNQLMAPHTRIR
jgi:hypothetical protein